MYSGNITLTVEREYLYSLNNINRFFAKIFSPLGEKLSNASTLREIFEQKNKVRSKISYANKI